MMGQVAAHSDNQTARGSTIARLALGPSSPRSLSSCKNMLTMLEGGVESQSVTVSAMTEIQSSSALLLMVK